MVPHPSHTERGSASPGGTRLVTGAPQFEQNFIARPLRGQLSRQVAERGEHRIRGKSQRVERSAGAIDPEDHEAEGLGAQRVPAVRGDEADALLTDVEAPYRELVDL